MSKVARNERLAIAATLGGAVLLTWLSTWPDWMQARENLTVAAELQRKVGDLDRAEADLARETRRLATSRDRQEQECLRVPATADVAGLMQALSLEVDGQRVRDQTFTVMDRPEAEANRFEVLPLQIEMEADFERIWRVLEQSERLPRLLRIAGLEISLVDSKEEPGGDEPRMLRAALALDVVYAPAQHGDRSR
ncbi:MAG: type 4a pilus biogenesis protein PilO [Phycisphaerales bacterium]|jgi:hypothetical protein|nr:type 4a pilus biogenesis protein PilO [Phycisphaerales bacterium]